MHLTSNCRQHRGNGEVNGEGDGEGDGESARADQGPGTREEEDGADRLGAEMGRWRCFRRGRMGHSGRESREGKDAGRALHHVLRGLGMTQIPYGR
jgi:hypothetical protein